MLKENQTSFFCFHRRTSEKGGHDWRRHQKMSRFESSFVLFVLFNSVKSSPVCEIDNQNDSNSLMLFSMKPKIISK